MHTFRRENDKNNFYSIIIIIIILYRNIANFDNEFNTTQHEYKTYVF